MIRAKAAFEVCKFANANLTALEYGVDRRQIYAEDEISEDIELGSRMHASGYKSIFISEKLATGEVRPLAFVLPVCPSWSHVHRVIMIVYRLRLSPSIGIVAYVCSPDACERDGLPLHDN